MRKAVVIASVLRRPLLALAALGAGWLALLMPTALAALWMLAYWAATAGITANTPKTNATKARVDALVTSMGGVNATVASIVATGVLGGISFSGTGTVHSDVLSEFTNQSQTAFLAGLSKLPHQSGLATDGFTGPSWGSGERGYVNSSINYINALDADLQSNGYMS